MSTIALPEHFPLDLSDVDDERFESWSALGVSVQESDGSSSFWLSADGEAFKHVGAVTVHDDGQIAVWPHEGLTESELAQLRAAGMDAFTHAPSEATCWSRLDGYWESRFSIAVDDGGRLASAMQAVEDNLRLNEIVTGTAQFATAVSQ